MAHTNDYRIGELRRKLNKSEKEEKYTVMKKSCTVGIKQFFDSKYIKHKMKRKHTSSLYFTKS